MEEMINSDFPIGQHTQYNQHIHHKNQTATLHNLFHRNGLTGAPGETMTSTITKRNLENILTNLNLWF